MAREKDKTHMYVYSTYLAEFYKDDILSFLWTVLLKYSFMLLKKEYVATTHTTGKNGNDQQILAGVECYFIRKVFL